MNTNTMKSVVILAAVASVNIASAKTMALYTFEDGVAGQTPTILANKADPGTYDASVAAVGNDSVGMGDAPFWTNNVPGNCVFSDAACTNVISSMPMALRFSSQVAEAGPNYATGGAIDISSLAVALKTTDKFTIEWFWKPDGWHSMARIVSLLYGGSASAAIADGQTYDQALRFFTSWDGCDDYFYDGNGAPAIYKNGWQHYALVVDRAIGEYKCYYRGVLIATRSNVQKPEASATPRLLFGVGEDWSGTGAFNRCNRGDITCIRVSDEVLEPSDFMRMGAGVFLPFKDGTDKATVTSVTNALVKDGSIGSVDGVNPTMLQFSSERPGKYVYSSSRRDQLLCEDPQSIFFPSANGGWQTAQSGIFFPQLGGRLAMLLDEMNEMTVEFFFKHSPANQEWNGSYMVTFSPEASHGNQWYAIYNKTDITSKQKNKDALMTSSPNEDESMNNDGVWHHAAFVFSKNSRTRKTVTVYLDYAKTPKQAEGGLEFTANQYYNAWNDSDLGIGWPLKDDGFRNTGDAFSKGTLGHVACVRILPAALKPEAFMVATDSNEIPTSDERLRWRFEDGAVDVPVTLAVDSSGAGKWSVGNVLTYGAGGTAPTYTSVVPGRNLTNDTGLAKNTRAISLFAANDGGRTILETKEWYGMPLLHPSDWTMEAFVQPDVASSDALIFGRGRLNPTTGAEWYDWAFVLQPNGKLGLKGYRVDAGAADGKTAYAYQDIGTEMAVGSWHHVAVSYASDTRTLSVTVDGEPKFSTVLDSEQFDNLLGRYMVGQGCGQGAYIGRIDEIRLSGHVLTTEELLRKYQKGMALFVR